MNWLKNLILGGRPAGIEPELSPYTKEAASIVPVSEDNGRQYEADRPFAGDDSTPGLNPAEQEFYGAWAQESYSPARIREALTILQESNPTFPGLGSLMEQYGYRLQNASIRDLSPRARLGILRKAELLSICNPLATRALQIRTDLIVSEGFKLVPDLDMEEGNARDAAEEEIQFFLDEYMQLNGWNTRMFERVYDLGVTGELIRRVPVLSYGINEGDPDDVFLPGKFKCGAVLPYYVESAILEPWDYEQVDKLILQPLYFETLNGGRQLQERDRVLTVVREHFHGEHQGRIAGDVFYTSVNQRVGSTRGISDLTPAIEYLGLHDQTLYADTERANLMMRFIWDITLQDASPKTIKNYAAELGNKQVKPGTHRIHNQKETWQAVSPDLNIPQTRELREDIFLYAWGALGLPRQWFVDAENVNKASAEDMSSPAFQWARTRRSKLGDNLKLEATMYLQVAHQAGRIKRVPFDQLKVKVVARDPDRRNYDTAATTLKDMGDALTVAINQGLIDQKNGSQIFQMVAGSFGLEVDPKTIDEAVDPMEAAQQQVQAQLEATRNTKLKGRIGGLDDDGGTPTKEPKPRAA